VFDAHLHWRRNSERFGKYFPLIFDEADPSSRPRNADHCRFLSRVRAGSLWRQPCNPRPPGTLQN
jgi:hypothetical protein